MPNFRLRALLVAVAGVFCAACTQQGDAAAGGEPPESPSVEAEATAAAVSQGAPGTDVASGGAEPASGGTRFEHPLGFELSLPPGWSVLDAGGGGYQLTPPDVRESEAIALTAARLERAFAATDADAIHGTELEISRQYPQLQRSGRPVVLRTGAGDAVRLDWTGATSSGVPSQLAVYVASLGDVAVSLLAGGPAADFAARGAELERILATLRASAGDPGAALRLPAPGTPGELHDGSDVARDWARRLSGKKLTLLSGYTSSGQSGGMNARYDLVLGPDGSYSYSGSSSVSMSGSGFDGSSVQQESSHGTWRMISQGSATALELTTENGKQYAALTRRGAETYMGGRRVFVTDP